MTEREDTIERIERVLKLTHKKSITVTIPKLTAERAVSMLKEQKETPFTCSMCSKHTENGFCGRWKTNVKDDDYCSYGEGR